MEVEGVKAGEQGFREVQECILLPLEDETEGVLIAACRQADGELLETPLEPDRRQLVLVQGIGRQQGAGQSALNLRGVGGSIKRLAAYASTPVILISTLDDEGMKQKAASLGAFHYMVKPFDTKKMDILFTKLKK